MNHFLRNSPFLLLGLVLLSSCQSLPNNPPPTVKAVELDRYTGLWHEVARLPVFFQDEDERATAEYSLNDNGTIALVNTAIAPDGSTRSVTGHAVPVPGSENTRLEVTIDNFFAKIFGSSPDFGNYWIFKLESDYSVALVGSPNRKTLWLLAREPQIPDEQLRQYIDYASQLGFDTDKLILNNRPL
ncbi:lipocalin family protein [Puniceicoccus vermicola]|uniref:Lipocalin family protein n=1 Tax=Puniceicoccus vermicola TaxID=388746 RepID=A0A7X1B2M7_9BACT|nr:lipocalin family protein [Puniceicoccus vermicola]MBC2604382.1 lipocalin family protein [Puniceicoccus vermicola]